MPACWRATVEGIILAVRATPRGGRNALGGVWTDSAGQQWLGVRVTAAPSDGAANDAIIRMLCIQFALGKSDVTLVNGTASRLKRFSLAGDPDQLAKQVEVLAGDK